MIQKNDTWKLVNKPKDKNSIGVKQVYRPKFNLDGLVYKYKSRVFVKGYAQLQNWIMETHLYLLEDMIQNEFFTLSTQSNLKLYHLGENLAFLKELLREQIYVDQFKGS